MRHPSTINTTRIRGRLRRLSLKAGGRHADGSPLELRPHDCGRVFASEHLNAHTQVHVIQALHMKHATVNSVMIYAKLYPNQLVEHYRAAMRGLHTDVYDEHASHTRPRRNGSLSPKAARCATWAPISAPCRR